MATDVITDLRNQFSVLFPDSGAPAFCRAPGRTNLIGEHTDYNSLPVLPMTVDREILVAYAPRRDGRFRLRNTDPKFPALDFANGAAIATSSQGSWDNYAKAAVHGLNARFRINTSIGLDMLVSSNLPVAAGLASSSALVVACALAYLDAAGLDLEHKVGRLKLADILAEAEHYVGTRGGGMDQAAILAGAANCACKINFHPLRVERVPLIRDCAVVVCDSTVKAEKSGATRARYNEGPRLCSVLCALIERQLQEEIDPDFALDCLGDLFYGDLCLTYGEAEELCMRAVSRDRMSLADIARRLGMLTDEVRRQWLVDLPEPETGFPMRARLRHQLTEYQRVEKARDALLGQDAQELGRLMNASHESCAREYAISCPELDQLVDTARAAGALGARLTGAGFGGATVNLVPEERCEPFLTRVEKEYYGVYLSRRGPAPHFVARAVDGAGYLR